VAQLPGEREVCGSALGIGSRMLSALGAEREAMSRRELDENLQWRVQTIEQGPKAEDKPATILLDGVQEPKRAGAQDRDGPR
jgi:hypothetical protein